MDIYWIEFRMNKRFILFKDDLEILIVFVVGIVFVILLLWLFLIVFGVGLVVSLIFFFVIKFFGRDK